MKAIVSTRLGPPEVLQLQETQKPTHPIPEQELAGEVEVPSKPPGKHHHRRNPYCVGRRLPDYGNTAGSVLCVRCRDRDRLHSDDHLVCMEVAQS